MRYRQSGWPALVLAAIVTFPACAGDKADKKKGHERAGAPAAPAVLQIGERGYTLEEIDRQAMAANAEAYNKLYEARRAMIDQIVSESLLDGEAKSRGITREALLEQEVTAKTAAVGDAEVQAFYEQNKPAMQGRTLEQVGPQIKAYLGQQRQQGATNALLQALRQKTDVKITLEPPRVEVRVDPSAPAKGPADAPVQIVEFSDFQCPYCSRAGATMARVVGQYGDKVRLVFRDFPLPFHDKAKPAAEAALCAHEQGQFWNYHDKLFGNQSALAPENLKQYAVDLGLDAGRFNACLDGGQFRATVEGNHRDGAALGVQGTPAFFVNGRFLNGAQPFEAFAAIIDEELQLKGLR